MPYRIITTAGSDSGSIADPNDENGRISLEEGLNLFEEEGWRLDHVMADSAGKLTGMVLHREALNGGLRKSRGLLSPVE